VKIYFLGICYHYLGDKDRYPYPGIVGITPEEFSLQINELSRYFEFVSIKDIVECIEGKCTLPEKCAVLTFDDGLLEHYEKALPILDKHNIPFIIFVNSAPYTENRVARIHKIHYLRSIIEPPKFLEIVKEKARDLCGLVLPENEIIKEIPPNYYPYDSDENRCIKYILNSFLLPENSLKIIDKIFSNYCNEPDFSRKFYMTKEQLREVHQKYHALGLHGHNHLSIAELSDDDARKEIFLCKEIIEEIVSDKLVCMSYPYGYKQAVSCREEKISKEAGLLFCFTMEMCFNRDLTVAPHLLGRINNNEAPGHKDAAFKDINGTLFINDTKRMKYHRSYYYSDLIEEQ
jgi:peptidoglycan/xylan/chitin deacetylase (PgdA/CDA1 family)